MLPNLLKNQIKIIMTQKTKISKINRNLIIANQYKFNQKLCTHIIRNKEVFLLHHITK